MVGGATIGLIGSIISGSAHKITTIIAGNVLCGIANAGCVCFSKECICIEVAYTNLSKNY